MVTEGAQTLQVLLRRRVGIHVEIHSGGHEHGGLHRQVGGDEHVVGHTGSHLAQCRRRAGGNEHGVGPETQRHVRVPCAVALREEVADDWLLRQCRQCDGCDELLAGRRDDHLHLGAALHQLADNQACLVGCYRARDAQHYFLSLQHTFILLFCQTATILTLQKYKRKVNRPNFRPTICL